MPNVSGPKDEDSTSRGHGALGMGGKPSDDPRNLSGGGETLKEDDRGVGTGPVGGAFGSAAGDLTGGGSANEVLGVAGDKGFNDAQRAAEKHADRK